MKPPRAMSRDESVAFWMAQFEDVDDLTDAEVAQRLVALGIDPSAATARLQALRETLQGAARRREAGRSLALIRKLLGSVRSGTVPPVRTVRPQATLLASLTEASRSRFVSCCRSLAERDETDVAGLLEDLETLERLIVERRDDVGS